MDKLTTGIALKRQGREQQLRATILTGKSKQLMDEIRNKIAEMSKVEEQLLTVCKQSLSSVKLKIF